MEVGINNLTREEKIYLAGILDGESSLGVYVQQRESKKSNLRACIGITNTNFELLSFVKKFTEVKPYQGQRGKHRPYWQILIRDQQSIKEILETTLPFLIVKKNHAKLILEFLSLRENPSIRSYSAREWEIVVQLKSLNK